MKMEDILSNDLKELTDACTNMDLKKYEELKQKLGLDKKEFHLWFSNEYPEQITMHLYSSVQDLIDKNEEIIHTTQVMACVTSLFLKGYKIFIHPYVGDTFELKLGDNTPYTHRLINMGHNLYRLLIAGEFDTKDKVVTW